MAGVITSDILLMIEGLDYEADARFYSPDRQSLVLKIYSWQNFNFWTCFFIMCKLAAFTRGHFASKVPFNQRKNVYYGLAVEYEIVHQWHEPPAKPKP